MPISLMGNKTHATGSTSLSVMLKWHWCLQHSLNAYASTLQCKKWHSNPEHSPINIYDTPKFNRNTDMSNIWHLHCTDTCYIFHSSLEWKLSLSPCCIVQHRNTIRCTCTDFHMLSYNHILIVVGKPLLFLEVFSRRVSTENHNPVSPNPMCAQ